jgi:hypothetical protein
MSVVLVAILPFLSTLIGGMAAHRFRHRLRPFMAIASAVLVATASADLLPLARILGGAGCGLEVGLGAIAGSSLFTFLGIAHPPVELRAYMRIPTILWSFSWFRSMAG